MGNDGGSGSDIPNAGAGLADKGFKKLSDEELLL